MKGIRFEGVHKTFRPASGCHEVLRGLDLEVLPGEFLCVVGPSGCGKSTLLNLAAGLMLPDQGRVLLGGRRVGGPERDCGMIFQEPPLFPWLSVRGNVAFSLRMAGLGKAERHGRADALLEQIGLRRFADAWPHQLSGGMKQRVALAAALAKDPEVLLLDEPFAALDAQTRDGLHEVLEGLWQETRKTVIFVTHNVREAVRLGDRVLLMAARHGRICGSYPVGLPRGRRVEDVGLLEIASAIRADLGTEVREHHAWESLHVGR